MKTFDSPQTFWIHCVVHLSLTSTSSPVSLTSTPMPTSSSASSLTSISSSTSTKMKSFDSLQNSGSAPVTARPPTLTTKLFNRRAEMRENALRDLVKYKQLRKIQWAESFSSYTNGFGLYLDCTQTFLDQN